MTTLYIQQHRDLFSDNGKSISRMAHLLRVILDCADKEKMELQRLKWNVCPEGHPNIFLIKEFRDNKNYGMQGNLTFSDNERERELEFREWMNGINGYYQNKLEEAAPNFDVKAYKHKRMVAKRSIKKWSETESPEQPVFERIYEALNNGGKINEAELLKEFNNIEGTISKYNNKKRAISNIAEVQNALVDAGTGRLKKRHLETAHHKHIRLTEHVFKIPEDNKVELTEDDLVALMTAYKDRFYPEFDIIASSIHTDEQGPDFLVDGKLTGNHFHMALSGFNNETNSFDYANTEFNRFKAIAKEQGNNFRWLKKDTWEQLSRSELMSYGEFYQTTLYDFYNREIQKLANDDNGYNNINFKKLPKTADNLARNRAIKNSRRNNGKKTNAYSTIVQYQKKVDQLEQKIMKLQNEGLDNVIEKLVKEEAYKSVIKNLATTADEIIKPFRINGLDEIKEDARALDKALTFKEQDSLFYKLYKAADDFVSKNPPYKTVWSKFKKVATVLGKIVNLDFEKLDRIKDEMQKKAEQELKQAEEQARQQANELEKQKLKEIQEKSPEEKQKANDDYSDDDTFNRVRKRQYLEAKKETARELKRRKFR